MVEIIVEWLQMFHIIAWDDPYPLYKEWKYNLFYPLLSKLHSWFQYDDHDSRRRMIIILMLNDIGIRIYREMHHFISL